MFFVHEANVEVRHFSFGIRPGGYAAEFELEGVRIGIEQDVELTPRFSRISWPCKTTQSCPQNRNFIASSQLLEQNTQQRAGESEMFDGLRVIEKQRSENAAARMQKPKPKPKKPAKRRTKPDDDFAL
ncbi:hypothetical protein [Rhizobium leguminosarum]|uniref:hypothetical protein n=1 Tax=Rhizobium leguminosarum TaxID=384 RepID=UPI001FE019B5|nr:hypothetical protein [Rhizobium leguminosarum]